MKLNRLAFLLVGGLLLTSCDNFKVSVSTSDPADSTQTAALESVVVEEANGLVQVIGEKQYEEYVAKLNDPNNFIGTRPCVVDFYAEWCGPCKKLAPMMDKMAEKYKGQVTFFKVDVDQNSKLADTYGIHSIPNVFFCVNGEIRSEVGLMPEEELEKAISALLAAPTK